MTREVLFNREQVLAIKCLAEDWLEENVRNDGDFFGWVLVHSIKDVATAALKPRTTVEDAIEGTGATERRFQVEEVFRTKPRTVEVAEEIIDELEDVSHPSA